MKSVFSLILLLMTLMLSGCFSPREPALPAVTEAPSSEETAAAEPSVETVPSLAREEEILQSMTLKEKIGQLFIIRPDSLDLSIAFGDLDNSAGVGVTQVTQAMADTLREYPAGGFILFQKNILNPDQTADFTASLTDHSVIPPFLAVDEEGGAVARLAGNRAFGLPRFKSAGAVGKEGPMAAQDMGFTIGSYLKDYGFNMDFAPVADVNTNPGNPVIGSRAFSSNPRDAAVLARAMADGLRMQGILPVFKHFPGHGDTAQDSHLELAVSYKTREQLHSCEWIPFLQAEDRECIMVGHIALPEITGDMTPATFSPEIVTGILREELSYQGLIVTDSLSMGAVTKDHSSGEAALLALRAGSDLLLMPASFVEAFQAVEDAVEDGSFSMEELDARVLRILKAKYDYHIIG